MVLKSKNNGKKTGLKVNSKLFKIKTLITMVFFCQVVGVFRILFTEGKTNFLFVCLFYQLNKRTNKLSETLQAQLN